MKTYVRKFRSEKSMSINKLHLKSGVGISSIVGLEDERHNNDPRLGTLIKIADALEVELIDLINFEEYREVRNASR